MSERISDEQIAQLIQEPKPLSKNLLTQPKWRTGQGNRYVIQDCTGERGARFRIIVRQSLFDSMSFSVILGFYPTNSNTLFRLRRYNGCTHEHTNHIEKRGGGPGVVNFRGRFHMHTATERYQSSGFREDDYAEPTENFADVFGAIRCMIEECGVRLPDEPGSSDQTQLDLPFRRD